MSDIFPSLIGNEKIKSLVSADIRNHSVNHAYIIEGPAGSGRHTFVFDMIKALACIGKGPETPCCKCENCKKISEGLFCDIIHLERTDTATVQAKPVRDLLETVYFSPNENCDYKFYIIDETEKMTPAAQNSLLLTLEEPPQYVIFFLLTEDASLLLETVRSRSVILQTELFTPEFIYNQLKSDRRFSSMPDEKLKSAASLGAGALGASQKMLQKDDLSRYADIASELVNSLCTGRMSDSIMLVSGFDFERNEFADIFRYCESAMRDLIAYKNGCSEFIFYSDVEDVQEICRSTMLTKLISVYNSIVKAKEDILTLNANVNLVMTHLAASAG